MSQAEKPRAVKSRLQGTQYRPISLAEEGLLRCDSQERRMKQATVEFLGQLDKGNHLAFHTMLGITNVDFC